MAQGEQEATSVNNQKALIVNASNGDRTPVVLWADKTTHRLLVDAGSITTTSLSDGVPGLAPPADVSMLGGVDGSTGVVRAFANQQGQGDANNANGFFPTALWGYNGASWDRVRAGVTGDGQAMTGFLQNVPMIYNGGTTLDRLRGGQGDGSGATGMLNIVPMVYNGSTYDRIKEAANALNSAGVGIPAAQIVGQFDDVAPTAITENQFGNLRMSANRNLYNTIRDAAGNERGVNVTAANELNVITPALGATGTAAPAKADYIASINFSGNLVGWQTAGRLSDGVDPDNIPAVFGYVYRGSNTGDRMLAIINAYNGTGAGIVAAGIMAQLDDTSPTAITENQFGNVRMSAKRALLVSNKPDTANHNNGKLISAASTNATSVVANAATIKFLTVSNINTAARYLKIYNKASAPTVGTDVPVFTFLIPGNASGAGSNIPLPPGGLYLGTGFAFALTTGVADNDTGAVAASDIVVNYSYENIG
jgi:hypothetical protein